MDREASPPMRRGTQYSVLWISESANPNETIRARYGGEHGVDGCAAAPLSLTKAPASKDDGGGPPAAGFGLVARSPVSPAVPRLTSSDVSGF
jgi:hypothetical protein